ncbi:S-adenosyl-L-methionine-dependent methyltransferase [Daldinia caldariorum]|uniref:S-adenosyl-L-methionine-dependent methyltransferase n=1 Tax=Daldinia caldariorum TaxID=326644 RepID=UPI002008B892|nr:S-adenosyl-L-methionine-dependent methyltransferase [Daldinia caldariorum]KAI1467920.1 S-adenosyl-L-methionine-dependent methyltransferase [Daldinia caldariorum]
MSRAGTPLASLLGPWNMLLMSAYCLPRTLLKLLREGKYAVLLSPGRLQDAWFNDFWGGMAGPNIRRDAGIRVVPLLEGRASAGDVVDRQVVPGLAGTVVEVGAGAGLWVDVYPEVACVRASGEGEGEGEARRRNVGGSRAAVDGVITRVYGIEPNRDQHPALRRAIAAAGLEDVYRIVPVGVEDLDDATKWEGRVEKGSVDCIVSILCLCSIPEPEKNVRELYQYLKKGGRWYVYEHVRCEHSWYMRAYQGFLNLFWPHMIGGCQLNRRTEKTLREAGPWGKINVGQPSVEQWHQVIPHVMGVFEK